MELLKVCRCCLAEDGINDIAVESLFSGKNETFVDMLLKTFNLNISQRKEVKSLICKDCAKKLKNADTFKKMVVNSEKILLERLRAVEDLDPDISLKQERIDFDENYDFDDKLDDISDSDFVWDVENNALKDEKGQIFVIKLEPKEEKSNEAKSLRKLKPAISKESVKKTKVPCSGTKIAKVSENKKSKHKEKAPALLKQQSTRENSLKLVLNSNMCLFKSLRTKFGCFHCKESFITMAEVREHTKTHSNVKNLKLRFSLLKGLSYKNVDISQLACKLCEEKCHSINILKTHLEEKHSIEFGDGGHFLIPYHLEDGFKCVTCEQVFNTFTRLSIHMNSHYTNNVCEICGVSYINRLSLRVHVSSVHKEKKCTQCSMTFLSHYSRVKHMRKSHNRGTSKRYCMLCDKTFPYTYMLMEHKIQEHGAKRQITDCPQCGKTFLSPQNMKVHVRSVHIKERNYPCSVCGMRFFTKCDQKRHERTHEDVRSFSCNYCEGKFKSKDSWRRHVKRQHGHLYGMQ